MHPEQLLDQFSTHLKNIIANSISFAASMNHGEVTPLHLFHSLASTQGTIAVEIIGSTGVKNEYLDTMLSSFAQTHTDTSRGETKTLPHLNHESKQALEKAIMLSYEYGSTHVGTEHLLHGLFHIDNKHISHIIETHDIDVKETTAYIETIIQNSTHFPDMDDVADIMDQLQNISDQQPPPPGILPGSSASTPHIPHSHTGGKKKKQGKKSKQSTSLEVFCVDLTAKDIQKTIDPVIGREKEIDRLIRILSRRTKNNPVLVGEAGVGKTAIVEGLAKRIVAGDVPDILRNKKILSLDLTLLIAGTIYRGEFESRLKQIIDEVSAKKEYILFIDEIHNIIGAGSNQGTMDAANILKPALARGQLRCIGATTIDEYKKHITGDPALQRRFQSIEVEEPTFEQTVEILEGVKKYYDSFHHTNITKDAIEAAVTLSTKYIHDNFLPDKAIDLIDEASAGVRVAQPTPVARKKYDLLNQSIEKSEREKEEATVNEQFEIALRLKEHLAKLKKQKKQLDADGAHKKKGRKKRVEAKDIAHVISERVGIDAGTLLASDAQHLTRVEKELKEELTGQDEAIAQVTSTLRQSYLGLGQPHKPVASFLFVGPSGVGKTALAKTLAKSLYHDDRALIKLDMSEFAEQHGISKLLGSPAGYIGHKERNRFTDEIRKRPYAVVLFDEIDKAHPDVIKLLLQILDEGYLTESSGKKIHFEHAIIILTTNVGAELYKTQGIGFDQSAADASSPAAKENLKKHVEAKLKEELDAAILGRVQTRCYFNALNKEDLQQIIHKKLREINMRLAQHNHIEIRARQAALAALAQQAASTDFGVRHVEQFVEHTITDLLSNILAKKGRKKVYTLEEKNGAFTLA